MPTATAAARCIVCPRAAPRTGHPAPRPGGRAGRRAEAGSREVRRKRRRRRRRRRTRRGEGGGGGGGPALPPPRPSPGPAGGRGTLLPAPLSPPSARLPLSPRAVGAARRLGCSWRRPSRAVEPGAGRRSPRRSRPAPRAPRRVPPPAPAGGVM